MKYNFDQKINRYDTDSLKWDKTKRLFGDENILPMWVADMDFTSPPPVIDALKRRVDHGAFGYTVRSNSYFEAFINWMERRHNWTINKRWIRCTPGIMPAISLAIQKFTEPEDKILIQTPVYHPYPHIVKNNRRETVNSSLIMKNGKYEMDYEDLERKIDSGVKMLLLCNPHNPVGRVWTREELVKLGEICMRYNVLVLSDEAHCDLVYKGHTHIPFASISNEFSENSITCTAPSKPFNIAGLQISNVVISNAPLREAFTEAVDALHLGSSNTLSLTAAESAYRFGDEWLDALIEYVEGNLDYLIKFIETKLSKIKVIKPEGTYLAWLDCRELEMNAGALEKFFQKEAKVAFDEGYKFGLGGEGFTRVNMACPRALLEEGLNRIEKAVNQNVIKN
ncbi:MalY/PatB family protein [Bacillus sp. PK3_68]|uniref:MalY/PatB family protein n=1 Tax=Bacillus sp. PK3_68 TaxID=2027408 RepID=UPI000E74837E|nr:MalY/PatB family protein [Bacillus sp. PK3_68]RJS62393.1 cystathionine beta-lyase [Bacillus sp. PK3_68]